MVGYLNRRQFLGLLALTACEDMILFQQSTVARICGAPTDKREAWCYGIAGQSQACGNSPNSQLAAQGLNGDIANCYTYYKPMATTDNDAAFDVDNGAFQPLSKTYSQLTDLTANNWYGPELKMASDLQNYYERDIFIIKFAIGDTALNSEASSGSPGAGGLLDWAPGSAGELYERWVTNYWAAARDKLLSYGRLPILKGFLWAQGERDCFVSSFASNYESNLTALFSAIRTAVNNADLQCAVARICDEVRDDRPFGTSVYTAQGNVAALTNNFLINTDAYVLQGDDVHYQDHSVLGADAAAGFITANP